MNESTDAFLLPGVNYTLFINATDGTQTTDEVRWRVDTSCGSGCYEHGSRMQSSDAGRIWENTSSQDFMFEIWGKKPLEVTLGPPGDFLGSITTPVNFTAVVRPLIDYNVSNATLTIWDSSNSVFTTNLTTLVKNQSDTTISFIVTNLTFGKYLWNVEGCSTNATGGRANCTWASSNFTFNYGFQTNSIDFNLSSFETANERFTLNITALDTYTVSSAIFNYAGTDYTGTVLNTGGQHYNISASIDIPEGTGVDNFYYKITLNGTEFTTNTTTQLINETIWTLCNATWTADFLNVTFKDEATSANTNASVPSANFEYYLGLGTTTKTFTMSNNSLLDHFRFCASPTDRTFNVNPFFQYVQGTLYPQRIWDAGFISYTNTLTTKVLYLLHSDDGIYVTFQIVNPSNQVLTGVLVNATTSIGGSQILVANQTTGDSGSVTFWLNPDAEHTFGFLRSGFDNLISTFFPTQTAYTITLGGASNPQANNYDFGIDVDILPAVSTDLVNGTIYDFNMSLTSSFWEVSEYGFSLYMANGTLLNSTSTTSVGTLINIKRDTANLSQIHLQYYWIVNGSVQTRDIFYNIRNTGLGDWSISSFFTDLNAYLTVGFFGIDNFGRNLIIFLIFAFGVGMMSMKFGVTSPMAVTFTLFAVTYFFDVAVGILPTPVNAIPNFLTFVAGLIFIIAVYREATR